MRAFVKGKWQKNTKNGCIMVEYYLAIDIGASSGRHIVAHLENGKMITEEIYRFENGPKTQTAFDGKPHHVTLQFCKVSLE